MTAPNDPTTPPPAPQGLKRIGHVFAAIALGLFVAYFVYAAHYDATAADGDHGRGAIILASFVAVGGAILFYVLHMARGGSKP